MGTSKTTITVWNVEGMVVMKLTGSRKRAEVVGWVRITPLGSIRFTCSASWIALIFFTLGLRALGLETVVDFGRGALVTFGLGNHGIHACFCVVVADGFGEGAVVVTDPGLPFFTLITR